MTSSAKSNGKVDEEIHTELEIYPDESGKTMFDRYHRGKSVPPYQGLKGKNPALTWLELFTQQQLPAWRPIITPMQVVLTLVGMGVLMVAIGVGCLVSTGNVVEMKENYSKFSPIESQTDFTNKQKSRYLQDNGGFIVNVEMEVSKDMVPPIYVYYELTNYYQNNRRYARSVSPQQLAGLPTTLANLQLLCEPMLYVNGTPNPSLEKDGLITPCGLQAWSYFNDTFQFSKIPKSAAGSNSTETAQLLDVDSSNIAWPSDRRYLYGNVTAQNFNGMYDPNRGGGTVSKPLVEEQHFMVWMKLAARPTFWKLWGVIDEELKEGDKVRVEIINQYNTYDFKGEKSIILSTNSWLGNRNFFLGALYVAVGGVFILSGCLFQVAYWIRPRGFGDERHLSWNRNFK